MPQSPGIADALDALSAELLGSVIFLESDLLQLERLNRMEENVPEAFHNNLWLYRLSFGLNQARCSLEVSTQ